MCVGQLYGLEKFWAFLKYSKAKTLEISYKLQEYLRNFRRLEDFRVDVSVCVCVCVHAFVRVLTHVCVLNPVFCRFDLQPPIDEGRKRHSSSGDGRRRHLSQSSARHALEPKPGPAPTAESGQ